MESSTMNIHYTILWNLKWSASYYNFALCKQKKDELVADYYDRFLWLCAIIPQQPNDIYLHEAFWDGLWTKVKIVIISMPWRTLAKITKIVIIVEE